MAQYGYVGLGMIVIEDYPQPDVKLDYFGGTSGTYAGFDRFDRVVDQKWYDYGASADRYKYGYDRASNRLWRENTLTSGKDEFYTYDGMYQLESAQRGDLTGTPPTGVTSKNFAQQWDLDPTGNWAGFDQDDNGNGTWDLEQHREHNHVNEIDTDDVHGDADNPITETTGTAWADPVHDAAGNMTTVPKPAGPASEFTLKYDAWNRLVEVRDGGNLAARYEYDGLKMVNKLHLKSPAVFDGLIAAKGHLYMSTRDGRVIRFGG